MRALLLIDLQNDFMPGGALAVNEGDQTVAVANKLIESGKFVKVICTQDWHPANHSSFKSNDPENGIWPDHCVQDTEGAKFHKDLKLDKVDKVFPKGTNVEVDSYSGFFDNEKKGDTGLNQYLKDNEIEEVLVLGLATDYCVKFTVLDALELGYKVMVILDGCRGVNLAPGDDLKAFEEMIEKGARIRYSSELFR